MIFSNPKKITVFSTITLATLAVLAVMVYPTSHSIQKADGQGTNYSIGPLFAFGFGDFYEAKAEANTNMWNMVVDIQSNLGPNESVVDVVVIDEYYDDFDETYTVEFRVEISVNGPPGA